MRLHVAIHTPPSPGIVFVKSSNEWKHSLHAARGLELGLDRNSPLLPSGLQVSIACPTNQGGAGGTGVTLA